MDTAKIISQYGPLAFLLLAGIFMAKNFFSDLGKELWKASSGAARGWLAFLFSIASFGSAGTALYYVAVEPVEPVLSARFTAFSVGALGLAGALTLHAVLGWLNTIARIQRGEKREGAKEISLFS